MAIREPDTIQFDPRDYGVTYDGRTDDTQAWMWWLRNVRDIGPHNVYVQSYGQTLIGQKLDLPNGVSFGGSGQFIATDNNTIFEVNGRYNKFNGITLKASGAPAIRLVRWARGSIRDVNIQSSLDHPAIIMDQAQRGGVFHTVVDGLTIDPMVYDREATASMIDIRTLGSVNAFNANTWTNLTLVGESEVPLFLLSSHNSRNRSNKIGIWGGFSQGGVFHSYGATQLDLEVSHFDTPHRIRNHVVRIGASVNGRWKPTHVKISGYQRASGTLDPGVDDIYLDRGHRGVTIERMGERPNTLQRINANGGRFELRGMASDLGGSPDWAIVNPHPDQTAIVDGEEVVIQ